MEEIEIANKLEITEVVNRLFIHTDYQEWDKLLSMVFAPEVIFDMSSVGAGEAKTVKVEEICQMWAKGFEGLDGIHHQAGHYLISIDGSVAKVFAYAVASHYKESATKGKTRSFTGSYDIALTLTSAGWRINAFKYNLKFADGNLDLT